MTDLELEQTIDALAAGVRALSAPPPPAAMTDEELSELAECLADACRGKSVGPLASPCGTCCPFGALLRLGYPAPLLVAEALRIPAAVARCFVRGFDGEADLVGGDPRAFALGRLFREAYAHG